MSHGWCKLIYCSEIIKTHLCKHCRIFLPCTFSYYSLIFKKERVLVFFVLDWVIYLFHIFDNFCLYEILSYSIDDILVYSLLHTNRTSRPWQPCELKKKIHTYDYTWKILEFSHQNFCTENFDQSNPKISAIN